MPKGKCGIRNPMNTRSNKQLLYGHSITHSRKYQSSVGVTNARCEHSRVVKKMKQRGINHNSPFVSKVKSRK